jgi:hypothetical protein
MAKLKRATFGGFVYETFSFDATDSVPLRVKRQ